MTGFKLHNTVREYKDYSLTGIIFIVKYISEVPSLGGPI